MELLFVLGLVAFFAILSAVLPPVGREGERDQIARMVMPPAPLHHV